MERLTIIFDNSPLSRLLEETEVDRNAFLRGLRTFALLRVTGMNVIETANIQDATLRTAKLRLLADITGAVDPYQTPNDLLGDIARAYHNGTSLFLGDDAAWAAVQNPEIIHDALAADGLAWHADRERWFRDSFEELRRLYQPLFESGELPRPNNAADLLKFFISKRETYYDMLLLDIYERHTGYRPTHAEFSKFLETSDTCGWALFWLARIYAMFQRAVQTEGYGWKVNAGMHDLDSAIYLRYCQWFVTSDEPQRRAFRLLNALNRHATNIIRYVDLRARFFIS